MLTNPFFPSSESEQATSTSINQPQYQQKFNVGRGYHKNKGDHRRGNTNRGRGGQRSFQRAGENDPYDMTVAGSK